jgi:hypothetical protein
MAVLALLTDDTCAATRCHPCCHAAAGRSIHCLKLMPNRLPICPPPGRITTCAATWPVLGQAQKELLDEERRAELWEVLEAARGAWETAALAAAPPCNGNYCSGVRNVQCCRCA